MAKNLFIIVDNNFLSLFYFDKQIVNASHEWELNGLTCEAWMPVRACCVAKREENSSGSYSYSEIIVVIVTLLVAAG